MKNKFLIEEQQDYNGSMEVTILPPSFDYWNKNEFLAHFYSKKYEMKLRSGKQPHPSSILFIGLSKRLICI
jgi:hypothetical protein